MNLFIFKEIIDTNRGKNRFFFFTKLILNEYLTYLKLQFFFLQGIVKEMRDRKTSYPSFSYIYMLYCIKYVNYNKRWNK